MSRFVGSTTAVSGGFVVRDAPRGEDTVRWVQLLRLVTSLGYVGRLLVLSMVPARNALSRIK
jgi:hypothetical protein